MKKCDKINKCDIKQHRFGYNLYFTCGRGEMMGAEGNTRSHRTHALAYIKAYDTGQDENRRHMGCEKNGNN
jgi:hypothetical protein